MFGSRKGDTGVASWALEEVATLIVVAQQVLRGDHGAMAGWTEDGRHDAYRITVFIYSLWQNCHRLGVP